MFQFKYKILLAFFIALVSLCLYYTYISSLKPEAVLVPDDSKSENLAQAKVKPLLRDDNHEEGLETLKSQLLLMVTNATSTYSIYVKPLGSGASLTINNEQMKAASMIKLFIMAEAFRQEKVKLINFDEEIMITQHVKVGGSGTLQNSPGESRKTIRELIDLMIIESDNTATNVLIHRLTMENINELISELGFKNTLLQRKMMDFQSAEKGKENYTSVVDIGIMLEKIYGGQCIGPEQDTRMLKILLQQTDNDKIPALLPGKHRVAHKTGELLGIMHDGGIVYGDKQDYIVCIMTKDSKDADATVKEIAVISKVIYQFLNDK